uniref:Transmembrane protein 87A n=2 Tax=Clastoptera arizonana TaxID=38151 RepID=A0A1B6CTU1_9HEMI
MKNLFNFINFVLSLLILKCDCIIFPEEGKWDFIFNLEKNSTDVKKSLFKESQINIQVSCESKVDTRINIWWTVSEVSCWRDFLLYDAINRNNKIGQLDQMLINSTVYSVSSNTETFNCSDHIMLKEVILKEVVPVKVKQHDPIMPEEADDDRAKRNTDSTEISQNQVLPALHNTPSHPVFKITKDGFYMLTLTIIPADPHDPPPYVAKVHIDMHGKNGYLSAADWPLLHFYGAMCLVYVVLGLAWLIVSFLQWRDLLRIQFWIGGVILLGMLEKAMFYAEYQNINMTGQPTPGAVLVAELVSCGKRTLARMLVIIVSLGFGIVKPRLGPMLHRTVATGILYFLLAATEAYLCIMKSKTDPANQMLVATIPLAVLDSAICWWIFTSLVQTTRTLRLRRNLVKLNLYRHFTNTLIFAVMSSVIFMLYSIKAHYFAPCLATWKELWVDDAYWKLLFSVILLVIMILWRPTQNNQRYAFTPLLDAPEDDDEDEEEQFISDAYGVKMRGLYSGPNSPKPKHHSNTAEDDLKWVEENIPTSLADSALPILDSDEEIMNTKFELSKMQ